MKEAAKPRESWLERDAAIDAELLRRARGSDIEAFDELVVRHERRVFTLAKRMLRNTEDAEDVTQQTFMNVLEHLDGFRGDSTFQTWISRIASYAALKVIRKRGGLSALPLDGPDTIVRPEFIADWREGPASLLERKETRRILQEALDELDDKYRLVFLLRDVGELSTRETAELLGLTEGNVKVLLLRARLALREKLTRVFGDESKRVLPHDHEEPPAVARRSS